MLNQQLVHNTDFRNCMLQLQWLLPPHTHVYTCTPSCLHTPPWCSVPFTLPANVLKQTLVIASFREPVQRVVSLYFHRVRYDWVSTRQRCDEWYEPAGARRSSESGRQPVPMPRKRDVLRRMQGGAYRQPFSDFIRTFHTQDEYAKLLGGDACCFHPAAYESDEASC